jgi:long-subunit fatty acid transport protein
MRKLSLQLIMMLVFLSFGTHQCMASGFYLSEVGTPGSLGTAGVANPVNNYTADSSWTNPAGMTGVQEDQIMAGLTLLLPKVILPFVIAFKSRGLCCQS